MKNNLHAIVYSALVLLLTGCAAPISWREVDHVKAIGWTQESRPIALAQEIRLQGVFGIITPDGALETQNTISHGRLVLITEESRIPVKISFAEHNEA